MGLVALHMHLVIKPTARCLDYKCRRTWGARDRTADFNLISYLFLIIYKVWETVQEILAVDRVGVGTATESLIVFAKETLGDGGMALWVIAMADGHSKPQVPWLKERITPFLKFVLPSAHTHVACVLTHRHTRIYTNNN